MGHPRLHKIGSIYYMRAKVPADVREIVGKREIKISLRTGDYQAALPKLRMASAKADQVFAHARMRLNVLQEGNGIMLSEEQIEWIAAKRHHDLLSRDEKHRFSGEIRTFQEIDRAKEFRPT